MNSPYAGALPSADSLDAMPTEGPTVGSRVSSLLRTASLTAELGLGRDPKITEVRGGCFKRLGSSSFNEEERE